MTLYQQIHEMFSRELEAHGRAFSNYAALAGIECKDMTIDGFPAKLFFNPARVKSVMADVSPEALQKRACFLCPDGLEDKQLTTVWNSPTKHTYFIRVNPFPIFSPHFTISSSVHERQEFIPHLESMCHLAKALPEMTIFYNGPMCGASAPDHMHFQAVPRHSLPIEDYFENNYANAILVAEHDINQHLTAVRKVLALGKIPQEASQTGSLTLGASHVEEWEPRWNIITWYDDTYHTIIFFRSESRPMCFFANEEERILFSPATVEMGGIGVVANRESFDRLTPEKLRDLIIEVADDIL